MDDEYEAAEMELDIGPGGTVAEDRAADLIEARQEAARAALARTEEGANNGDV